MTSTSSGKPLAPFSTSSLDYGLSGTGPHAGPKSVCTFTFNIAGLKRSLTHNTIPFIVM